MSNLLKTLECAGCTAPLSEVIVEKGVHRCPFCGYVNVLPKPEQTSEVRHHLYNADEELKDYEFERAYNAFAKASELDPSESKAYFGMALATNRIKYIKDVVNNRWQAICCEVSDKKFSEDKNYLRALEHATPEQREEYTSRAEEIDYIREKFSELEKSGLSYDTFICVKVSDENGGFTQDSVWAGKLYDSLKRAGQSPFFSEKEIGTRVGEDYEALILYALYKAKSMIIVCSNEDYLRTPWVQNEYTRYYAMMNEQEKLKNSIMIAFTGDIIERIPGIHGKLQGVELHSFDASQKIIEFVARFSNAEERARAEAEAKAKKERERKEKEEAEAKAREEQRAEIEELKKALREVSAQKTTEKEVVKAEKPAKVKPPKPEKKQEGEKKNKKPLIIILVVLGLLAIFVGSLIFTIIRNSHRDDGGEKATVTFDLSLWTGAYCDTQSMEVEVGKSVENLPTPTLDGWNFISWYTLEEFEEVSDGAPIIIKNNYVFEEDTTLYAYFQRIELAAEATVTFDLSHWPGASCDEDEKTFIIGRLIGPLPKPTLEGYKFKGWYTEDEYELVSTGEDAEKVKTTLIVESDITLYAYFEKTATDDDSSGDGSSSVTFDCANGVHNWAMATTEPTCTKAGTKVGECQICHKSNSDAIYSAQNPALGHDYSEWEMVPMSMKRTCNRVGCAKTELETLEDITSNATVTVSSNAGGWPALPEWSGILTDGIWEGRPNAAPRSGSPLTITILFNTSSEVDQIAMSVQGFGEDGDSKFEVYLWYANEVDFCEESAYSGAFLSTSGTKDGAICIDRTNDDRAIKGIKIVMPNPLHGAEYFHEIAVGKFKED